MIGKTQTRFADWPSGEGPDRVLVGADRFGERNQQLHILAEDEMRDFRRGVAANDVADQPAEDGDRLERGTDSLNGPGEEVDDVCESLGERLEGIPDRAQGVDDPADGVRI